MNERELEKMIVAMLDWISSNWQFVVINVSILFIFYYKLKLSSLKKKIQAIGSDHHGRDIQLIEMKEENRLLQNELSKLQQEFAAREDIIVKENDVSLIKHEKQKLEQQLNHLQTVISERKKTQKQLQKQIEEYKRQMSSNDRMFVLPIIHEQTNVQTKIDSTPQEEINEMLSSHQARIARWNTSLDEIEESCLSFNETTRGPSGETDSSPRGMDDEKSESPEESDTGRGNKLFQVHMNHKYLIDEQLQRLEGLCGLVAQLNHQRSILQRRLNELRKETNGSDSKFSQLSSKYSHVHQQRVTCEGKLQELFRDCLRLSNEENGLMEEKSRAQSVLNALQNEMRSYNAIYDNCKSLIGQYNAFQVECNKSIPMIQENLQLEWKSFEAHWFHWNICDILCWLKYKLNWFYSHPKCLSLVEKNMRQQEMDGKKFITLNKSDLMKLGFAPNYDLCCEIFEHVGILSATYPTPEKAVKKSQKSASEEHMTPSYKLSFAIEHESDETEETPFVIPDRFLCPITSELMSEPVQAFDNHIYEKKAIEEYLSKHNKSPVTNDIASQDCLQQFTYHQQLKEEIDYFKKAHRTSLERLNSKFTGHVPMETIN